MRGKLVVLLTLLAMFGSVPATAAAATTRGYVYDNRDDALVAFDPATNTITNRIAMNTFVTAFGVRPDGAEIYATDWSNKRVLVLSTANHAVVARIPVGSAPEDVEFTPDSRRAYVALRAAVAVVDTGTRRVIATVPLGNNVASDVATSPDGSRVYVGTQAMTEGGRALVVISTATNTITKTIQLGIGGATPDQVAFSPNGRLAVLRTGHVIDTTTDSVIRQIPLNRNPVYFEFNLDSSRLYAAFPCAGTDHRGALELIDIGTGQTVRTIITGGHPYFFSVTPDSMIYIVLYGQGAVAKVDPANNRIVDTFGVAGQNHDPLLGELELSDTAPAGTAGQRFAPHPLVGDPCDI